MSFLSTMEAKLPPGFRFHPRDEELISDYLAGKVSGDLSSLPTMMIDVDLNKCEPWDLPQMACVGGKEWYFYSLQGRKYASGQRANRSTASGYWKVTGKDRPVVDPRRGVLVGMRKTLVFYHGRPTRGKKTDWIMHEFRMERSTAGATTSFSFKEHWVLCRVFRKSRGLPSKLCTDNSHDNTGPSFLLPLLDATSFEQAQLSLKGYEQLPCFSTHPPPPGLQPQPRSSPAAQHLSPVEENMPEMAKCFTHPEWMPELASYPNTLSYERMAMKEVLDHLPMLDGNPKTKESSGSHLSEAWPPHVESHLF